MHGAVLVTLTRGSTPESEHHGSYCVVQDGEVTRARGNMETTVFWRSAAKPIQAMAVIETGAADRFGLTPEEVALCVGSHDGSVKHSETALSILTKAGEDAGLLRCGGHPPLSREVAHEYIRDGFQPGRLQDNCSGKHAGMIAAAKAIGADPAAYADPAHPVQQLNLHNMALLTGLDAAQIKLGTDGCAVPSFGVPLPAIAQAAARYLSPDGLPEPKAAAARRIFESVKAHPEMIAGPKRLATAIVRAGKGRLLAKSGAEGVYMVGRAGGRSAFAVKIADGRQRALQAVVVALLEELGWVEPGVLGRFFPRAVLSREGDPVGEMRVVL